MVKIMGRDGEAVELLRMPPVAGAAALRRTHWGQRTIGSLFHLSDSLLYIRVVVNLSRVSSRLILEQAIIAHLTRTTRQRSTDDDLNPHHTESSVLASPIVRAATTATVAGRRRDRPQALDRS